MPDQDAVEQAREAREHERKAQEHASHERDADTPPAAGGPNPVDPDDPGKDDDDSRAGKPGPAGNTHLGGGLTGSS